MTGLHRQRPGQALVTGSAPAARSDGMSCSAWRWARKRLPGGIALALLVTLLCARCTQVNGAADPAANPMAVPHTVRPGDSGAMRIRVFTFMHKGVRQYVSRRPEGISARVDVLEVYYIQGCYLCRAPKDFKVASLRLDTQSYRREIEAASALYGVDRALVRAVMHAESGFRPSVISIAGAQGLMQLMPATAERFAVTDPLDARQNIRGGVRYLAWLLKRFNGNETLALAGYNAGEASVEQYKGVPPYAETQSYVTLVRSLTERYRRQR